MKNLNEIAREITKAEGGKVNLSIAQVKEVIRLLIKTLANMPFTDVIDILRRSK